MSFQAGAGGQWDQVRRQLVLVAALRTLEACEEHPAQQHQGEDDAQCTSSLGGFVHGLSQDGQGGGESEECGNEG